MEKFEFTEEELSLLLQEAYRVGFATFEMVDAGLETYDKKRYADWAILGIKYFRLK